ncbi:MAG TPA: hypothetical protein VF230_02610, partial [Acidimicrobiales bacterium]
VDPQRLRASLDRGGGRAAPVVVRPVTRPGAGSGGPELEALRLAVHRPEDVAPRLEGVLFADEVNLAAFEALCDAETLADAIAIAPPEAAEVIQRLAVEDVLDVDASDVVLRLVDLAARRARDDLIAEGKAGDWSAYAPTITWLSGAIDALNEPQAGTDTMDQLVAWLVQLRQERA